VSEQFLNSTSAQYRLFSATQLKAEEQKIQSKSTKNEPK